MSYAWFVCGYINVNDPIHPNRYCAMDTFTAQIYGEGGEWSESEVLGGYAVVKVRASDALLSTIAGTAGYYRIPDKWVLSDYLDTLTNAKKNAINNRLLAMGYTQAEIDAALGSTLAEWKTKTLHQLLNMAAQKRLKPRWDAATQQIILDGDLQACRLITDADASVP